MSLDAFNANPFRQYKRECMHVNKKKNRGDRFLSSSIKNSNALEQVLSLDFTKIEGCSNSQWRITLKLN